MTGPRLLDLFSGAGGAGTGYHRAGFEVVGVDISHQPRYPFRFVQADALEVLADRRFLAEFDVIHASPPCQAYSDLAFRNGNADSWPRLIGRIRELLMSSGRPYVIENVEGAPLLDPLMLCGVMFPGLRVLRHRLFESSMPLSGRDHKEHPLVFTYDRRKAHYQKLDQNTAFVQVTGGGNATKANKAAAMGIDWPMMNKELNEAIPPAYTEFIGRQLLADARHDGMVGWVDRPAVGPRAAATANGAGFALADYRWTATSVSLGSTAAPSSRTRSTISAAEPTSATTTSICCAPPA